MSIILLINTLDVLHTEGCFSTDEDVNPSFSSKTQKKSCFQVEVWNLFASAGEGEIVRWSCSLNSSKNTLFCTLVMYLSSTVWTTEETNLYTSLPHTVTTCSSSVQNNRKQMCLRQTFTSNNDLTSVNYALELCSYHESCSVVGFRLYKKPPPIIQTAAQHMQISSWNTNTTIQRLPLKKVKDKSSKCDMRGRNVCGHVPYHLHWCELSN